MNKLEDLQKRFVSIVLDKNYPQDFMERMKTLGSLDPKESLEVYQEDYYARLSAVLYENFEACHTLLGDERFHQLVFEFLDNMTSKHYDLERIGDDFPSYIQTHQFGKDYPMLVETAVFEKTFRNILNFEVASGLAPDILMNFENPLANKWTFAPSTQLLRFDHPVYDFWQLAQNPDHQVGEGGQDILLFRHGHGVQVIKLEAPQYELMQKLLAGKVAEQAIESTEGLDQLLVSGVFQIISGFQLVIATS